MINTQMNISIVIPSYEPDQRLLNLLSELRANYRGEIVLVDDGSGSQYSEYFTVAKSKYQCTILRHYVNFGKGRALKTAFNYLLDEHEDLVGCVTADSDGQHTVKDILQCMNLLLDNPDSMIMGCRSFKNDDIPFKSRFGNNLTTVICKYLCGVSVSDTQTGLRGIPSRFMEESLQIAGERFEFETRMLLATKGNYPIIETPIYTIYDSKENHQTHFDPLRDSIRIYKIIGASFFRFICSSLSSSILDLGLFHMLSILLCGLGLGHIALATIGARIVSAGYNYWLNHALVFKSKEKKDKALLKYICLAVVQMFVSAGLTTLGCYIFSMMPELSIKVVVDILLFMLSYYIQREFVF